MASLIEVLAHPREIVNQEIWKDFTVADFRALKTLISLLDDNEGSIHYRALNTLSKKAEVIIKPSDKGGNVVIMDDLKYRNMCWDILKNRTSMKT